MSGAENRAERTKKSDERSGAVNGSRKKNERSKKREVAERERSGERTESAAHVR